MFILQITGILAGCQEESTHAEVSLTVGIYRLSGNSPFTDGLYIPHLSIILQGNGRKIIPCFLYYRAVFLFRQITVVDPPQQSVTEEGSTRCLIARSLFGIHHRPCPVSLRLLQISHGTCQTLVFLHEKLSVLIGLRHIRQHLCQSGKHPSVATRPEILLPGGRLMFRIHIFTVTEIKSGLTIEHDTIRVKDVLIQFIEVLRITCQQVHLRHHRHDHIERISPPPVVADLGVGLIAHHLLGSLYTDIILLDLVQIDIRLKADLPVAKEHIVLAFTIVLVLPLGRIRLFRPFPLVMLCPTDTVVEHLFILQQVVHLHITGVVGSVIPEGAHLGFVMGLPVGVHPSDHLFYLISLPGLGLHTEGHQECECQKYLFHSV